MSLPTKAKSFLDDFNPGKWAENGLPHKLFLYGPPKAGKTSLALSSGTQTLHISTEPSANVLRNERMEAYRDLVDTYDYEGLAQLLHISQGICEGHPAVSKYEHLVIDTQDGVNNIWMSSLASKAKDARQDYKALLEEWTPVIYYLAHAPINVTVIAHEREKQDEKGTVLGVSGNVSGGVRLETCGKMDSVGRLYDVNGSRKISFKKTGTVEVGSRTDLDGKIIPVEEFWPTIRKWENSR